MTLDSIADALGVNKYYVSRIFSNKIKVNFRTYLGSLRSNYAAQLINISDEKLSDIAEKAGFESMRSFYRVFPRNVRDNSGRIQEVDQTRVNEQI